MLSKIRPSPEEEDELRRAARELQRKLEEEAAAFDDRIKVALLGSASRGTWLKNEKDLDFFLLFPEGYSKEELEEVITQIGEKILESPTKRFAEHPYIRGFYGSFEVEIVPCYAVASPSKLKSAVDRTPFHDSFVKENLRGKEDEVRLLKQFLKGIGCYGAEAKVEGFSGYLCELLIIKYGSFKKVLEEARKWRPPKVLWLGEKPDLDEVMKKFRAPLIFIDPVDRNRNVASALSLQKFSTFVYAAKEYLKNPREEFFFPRKREIGREEVVRKFKERGTRLVAVIFTKPDVVDDVLYPQLRKFLATLRNYVAEEDFEIVDMSFFVGEKICVLVELSRLELPKLKLHMGPKINSSHEERFLAKYKNYKEKLTEPFIRDGRWYIILKRKFCNVVDYINSLLSQSDLENKGVPKYISKSLQQGFRVKTDEEAILEEFLEDLLNYFDPTFPWQR
jgi:tRNA nucleotidyltransferase (CCA-adding enzyme)